MWTAWVMQRAGFSRHASSPGPEVLLSALVEELRLAEDAHDCLSIVCRCCLMIDAIVVGAELFVCARVCVLRGR